jgi:cellulose biosynthesis protein BcsQ
MKRITIFNHKGGVGKTTLTVNVAAALARRGKRVLLVDSDPQCNLTAYLLADEVVNELLDESDRDDGETLWSAVRPVYNSSGGVRVVEPKPTVVDNLFLLPGDIRLSEFEQFLADAWNDAFKRRLGPLRATAAISTLAQTLAEKLKIDFVFYDTGPNIGPLNRVLLLDSDYFIVPVACDLFSMRALSTLGQTLAGWITDWATIGGLAPDSEYLLRGRPVFLGFIPQQFKVYGQTMAKSPSYYMRQIQKRLHSSLVAVLQDVDPSLAPWPVSQLKLGEVKEFGQIIEHAQRQGVPLRDVENVNATHAAEAWEAFDHIAAQIIKKTSRRVRLKRKSRKRTGLR